MQRRAASIRRNPADEQSLVKDLEGSRYFVREARLDELGSLLLGLAWSLGLIFLSGAPGHGMQPLLVQLGGLWWRYSLIGDLALVLVCLQYRRGMNQGYQLIVQSVLPLLALLHGLTSWHDPFGVFFSNAFIEWLLLLAFFLLLLPWTGQMGGRTAWALFAGGFSAAILAGLFSLAAHVLTLLGLAARRLIVKLLAGASVAGLLPWSRWNMAVAALCLILLALYIRQHRFGLDPGLARLRKKALLDQPAGGRRVRSYCLLLLLLCIAPQTGEAAQLISRASLLEGELTQSLLSNVFSRLGSSKLRYQFRAVTKGLDEGADLAAPPLRDWRDLVVAEGIRVLLATNAWAEARGRLQQLSRNAAGLRPLLEGRILLAAGDRKGAARAFAACLLEEPSESQAWQGLAEAGCEPQRYPFSIRARAIRSSRRGITVLYDAALAPLAVRYVWLSYALARALYRFEGLWRMGASMGDYYEETMDEHLFALRVAVTNWKRHKLDTPDLADSFFDRLTELEHEGLLAGFVWFECWRPASLQAAGQARLRYADSIKKYCECLLLRPLGQPSSLH